ncbi:MULTISPECIES: restriction endonuclease subunit S [unclassified Streptomyces]|uniref:restriction endonuclease subunit S n=1 Tax=unclassified Streptomyces TaxID=2593676 RepID=UPI002366324B|nr:MULTISPECIES: restriction endonuclease subunit S [unclassified Streptomyces]MDF3142309.1 restriction endonuclease subunit S [Streptomyces sp. T21Q-yed]WDF40662.1 restriction endonuclease subunit S [Streptomyces sp. T12]
MSAEDSIRWLPVGEVGDVRMGKQLSPTSRANGEQFPYLRVANVLDGRIDYSDVKLMGFTQSEREAYALQPGDILLNEGQSLELVGRSAIYRGPAAAFFFQNTLVRFRARDLVLPEYAQAVFSRWLSTGVFASIAKKTTSIAHLGGDRFAKLLFPVRSLTEQQRIVEALAAFAEAERALEGSISKLRILRRGAHLSLMSAVDAHGVASKSWSRVPLKDVVPSTEYGISEALVNDPSGVPVLRMNNLQNGQPDVTDLRYCPVSIPQRLYLKRGDVLFNRTNSIDHVGKAALWREELPTASFASYLVRLNPDSEKLLPEYLVEWLQHPVIRQRVRAISTVAVQQVNVNPTRLRELEIDFPSDLAEQRRIVSTLASFDDRIGREVEELAKLRRLKQGLTDDLLSGRVRVPEVA